MHLLVDVDVAEDVLQEREMAERMHVLRGPLTSIGPAQFANPALSDAVDDWIGSRNAPKSFMSMLMRTPEQRTTAPVPAKGVDGTVGALILSGAEGEKGSGRGQGASWRCLETDSDDSLLDLDALLHSSLDDGGLDAGERHTQREETHPAQNSPTEERAPKTGRGRQSERGDSPTLEMCVADVYGMSEFVDGIADRYQRQEEGDSERGVAGDLQCTPSPPVLHISPWSKDRERLWQQKLQHSGGVPHAHTLTHKSTQSPPGYSLSPDSRRSRPLNSSSPSAGSDDSFRNLRPSPPAVYQVSKLSAHRPHERNSVLLREQRQGGGAGGGSAGGGSTGGGSAGGGHVGRGCSGGVGDGVDGRGEGRATDWQSCPERSLWEILEKDVQARRGRGGAVSAEEWEKHKAGIAGGTRRALPDGDAAHGRHMRGSQSDVSEYLSWFADREREMQERSLGTREREGEFINDTEGKTAKRPSTHTSVTSALPPEVLRKTEERKETERTSTHSLLSTEVLRKTVKRPEAERTSILASLRTERKATDGLSILSGVLKTIQVRLKCAGSVLLLLLSNQLVQVWVCGCMCVHVTPTHPHKPLHTL